LREALSKGTLFYLPRQLKQGKKSYKRRPNAPSTLGGCREEDAGGRIFLGKDNRGPERALFSIIRGSSQREKRIKKKR